MNVSAGKPLYIYGNAVVVPGAVGNDLGATAPLPAYWDGSQAAI